jgi:hypothetical protein
MFLGNVSRLYGLHKVISQNAAHSRATAVRISNLHHRVYSASCWCSTLSLCSTWMPNITFAFSDVWIWLNVINNQLINLLISCNNILINLATDVRFAAYVGC